MNGIGVSEGSCYAKLLVYREIPVILSDVSKSPDEEEKDFINAVDILYEETVLLAQDALDKFGKDAADIFDAHCSIIKDEEMIPAVIKKIKEGKNAASAVEEIFNSYAAVFESMENEYMASRANDMRDIKVRLQKRILGIEEVKLNKLSEKVVIAGYDTTPSITANMDIKNVAGILVEMGGKTSHTAILARILEIPAIVGVKGLMDSVETGQMVAFDASTGEIHINPDKPTVNRFIEKIAADEEFKKELKPLAEKESITADGIKFSLFGNIGSPSDVDKVKENGGEGVGLFRSEFLFLKRSSLPSENEQFEAYKEVLEKMPDKHVTVRTLDVGGDKSLPAIKMPHEENPFLGVRAIRLCREKTDVFKNQLRALLRASIYGHLHIMLPMVSCISELRWAKEVIEECKRELREEGLPFAEHVPIGIMIEIPSAAIMAYEFAKECDFFSIGTNDLIQYTLAVDRGNEPLTYIYTQYNPAVIRLIKSAIDGAHKAGISCGMCGEAASDPVMMPLLIGMGLDEFSMSPPAILRARKLMSELKASCCKEIMNKALELTTPEEIELLLKSCIK